MKDKFESAAYYGCCLIVALIFGVIAVGLGWVLIALIGDIVRMF